MRSLATSALWLLMGIALLGLFGRIMGYELRRDEFMFVPPAALLGDYTLYRDLFYNHVPYSAWLFRIIHLLLPWLSLLAAARLTIFLGWLLLLGASGWIGWRLTRSALVALFGPVSLLTAEVLLGQTGMAATNNLLPLPFALIGLGLFAIAVIEGDFAPGKLFAAGVALSIAAGMKASAIAFVPAVAIASFLIPRDLPLSQRLRRLVLPVGLGGLVGALPLFWLALSSTELFFAHIAGYHSGPHVAYWQENAATEPGLALSAPAKLQLAYSVWLVGAPLLAIFIAALSWVLSKASRQADIEPGLWGATMTVFAAVLVTAALAFVPTPGFPQYYAGPLIGFPLLAALFYRASDEAARSKLRPAMIVALVMMAVFSAPRLGIGLNDLRDPDRFTTARVAGGAAELRQALAEADLADAGLVATFSPLYPLEAGLRIYPEFSAGLFAYRVAPYTDPELRRNYVMAGAQDLPALFETNPPDAFLTGFDDTLEAPMIDYARNHGYVESDFDGIRDRYGKAVLWLRQPPAGGTETGENS
ncbi:hypothetical protein [Paracoccus sediminicola]|uniref:hypothetical protein n=1 Tax=Paracoccus sediminicola TaxID=3017783 RepID=UPI0022F00D93|nr:hypothetical protein [Paracoccus sediminicola]WBU56440.1 hypothetical protein PAF18_13315 [Paracoccus sediminicola]